MRDTIYRGQLVVRGAPWDTDLLLSSPNSKKVRRTGGARVTRQVYTLRYQGELLGLWDPQNRDLRRKLPPETKF